MARAPFNLPESRPLDVARGLLNAQGKTIYTNHAIQRMGERAILPRQIEIVLRSGSQDPDPKRTRYDADLDQWTYAAIGRDSDGRRIRVVFALIAPDVLVVTAVELSRSRTAIRRKTP